VEVPLREIACDQAQNEKGRIMGMEGNLIVLPMLTLVPGILTFSGCYVFFGIMNAFTLILFLSPFFLSTLYILLLKNGKPGGYDIEVVTHYFVRDSWEFEPQHEPIKHVLDQE
jgi:hypothetical protein